jgi:predicted nucleotidyltransferase
MIRLLNDEEIKLEVRDVVITGSNASYNYTKESDIDVHILAKTSNLNDPDKVYPKLYNAYRRIFASKYDISFYGIPVEVYIEVEGNETVSNGCYSVMFDHWVKEPSAVAIPEIDQKAIDEAAKPWKEEAQTLLGKNDIDAIDDYINRLYELRQKGLYSSEGVEYSTENLIFKEVRNDGFLDKLKQHRDELTSQELSLESLEEELDERTRREYVTKIAQIAHDQPIVHPNGIFELHNISEQDANFIIPNLRRMP